MTKYWLYLLITVSWWT